MSLLYMFTMWVCTVEILVAGPLQSLQGLRTGADKGASKGLRRGAVLCGAWALCWVNMQTLGFRPHVEHLICYMSLLMAMMECHGWSAAANCGLLNCHRLGDLGLKEWCTLSSHHAGPVKMNAV